MNEFAPPRHPLAPSREEIATINDPAIIWEKMAEASDVIVSIETQLEFIDVDEGTHRRRVTALISWRQASRNLKARLLAIRGERKAAQGAAE